MVPLRYRLARPPRADRDGHHLGGQQGPHLLEADGTGGEARAGVGVDVAAVEGVGLLGALEAVGLLVDLAHRLDAEVLRHQVRCRCPG
jgi:hypothetical protein